jgi:hypothetical protein
VLSGSGNFSTTTSTSDVSLPNVTHIKVVDLPRFNGHLSA